jgi:hypothetical protein
MRDPAGAREALTMAGTGPTTEIGRLARFGCLGLVEYLEGDDNGARRDLEAALKLAEEIPRLPYRDGAKSLSRAYLCRVLARQGDFAGARKHYAAAEKYLRATGETGLMAECQARLAG